MYDVPARANSGLNILAIWFTILYLSLYLKSRKLLSSEGILILFLIISSIFLSSFTKSTKLLKFCEYIFIFSIMSIAFFSFSIFGLSFVFEIFEIKSYSFIPFL